MRCAEAQARQYKCGGGRVTVTRAWLVTLAPQTSDSDHCSDIRRHRDIGDHGAGETIASL